MFPGAGAGPDEDAAYAIVGAPLERSTTFYPGARFGPDRIRHFAEGFEDYDPATAQHFSELGVVDCGDVRPWQDAEAYLSFLSGELGDRVDEGAIPVLIGGEHTVSLAGVRATNPSVYVCIDAHLDLRPSFDDDPWSHATTTHHVLEHVARVILLGARAGSAEEWARAAEIQRVTIVPPEGIREWAETASFDREEVYLSIDTDGIDPAYAPATGTREPFGLAPADVRRVIAAVAPAAVGFDLVEVTDRDEGETAVLGAKLLRSFVYEHARNR